ncbi:hypothetical protein BDB00DRAFT_630714 [Zychaea mexicana]|uniref:uncharacterized protein n=1 Tax=Zychaea mexicana TaxID=64656 RepID=UPI0022FF1532|nr:uncharacterized protein BDB00DRAFT_630714 [Zychaea mexicana]KAI9489307.1 hypothetical protein BDB00DRAFT_630714 [Zychaea mexicana]
MSTVSGEQHEQDRISRQRHEQEGVDDNDHRHQHRERRSSITSITNNTAPPPTYHYSQGGVRYYDDDGMSYSGSEDRFSFSSNGSANSSTRRPGEKLPKTREKYSSSSFVQTTFFPIINMIVTVALIGVMIMVYIRANGQTIGTTQAGMAYPTVMALVVTILVTFISGGIGYAVSEYKWLRFQKQESQLSLMDVYDSCSRGIGGVLRVILFLKFDSVIIATIIFSLGLLAIPPAAQQVLHSHTPTPTQICEEDSYYYPLANSIESGEQTTYQYRSNDPRSIKGLMQHSEIQFYMKQYMLNVSVQASLSCAPDAINCTFPFLTTPHVTMECEPGSWDTQIVDRISTHVLCWINVQPHLLRSQQHYRFSVSSQR